MFIVICAFRARAGEEDAIVALHEDWQRTLHSQATGYLSGELLNSVQDPRAFIAIACYEDETSARAVAADPKQVAWQRRLTSLMEVGLICDEYRCAWQSDSPCVRECYIYHHHTWVMSMSILRT